MKPFLISCFLLCMHTVCAQDMDRVVISIELEKATLEEAFHAIESITPFTFNYKTADIAGVEGIRYKQQQVAVRKVLDEILSGTSLQFEQMQQYIFIKKTKTPPAKAVKVFGYVRSGQSGEALCGASVSITGNKTYSALTNAYGFYSVTLPAGDYSMNGSHIGFTSYDHTISLQQSLQNNIHLAINKDDSLPLVMVTTATRKNITHKTFTGHHRVSMDNVKRIPAMAGEPDVLKSLQFLPGIQSAAEGTTNLSVRGGSYDQNLILLDEVPIYNPGHTMGIFSAFNTDVLKDVTLYKGVFPAQYGNRLSSVVDMRMREGNNRQHTVSGGIGLTAARLTWEGPIKKERSSFIISGRYNNLGALMNRKKISGIFKIGSTSSQVNFYDINAKYNTILGRKDRLYLSAYTSHDQFSMHLMDKSDKFEWGNTTFSARWNHVFNSGLFANTSIFYSHYNYSNTSIHDTRNFTWRANLQELTLKTDFDKMMRDDMRLKFGGGITGQYVLPGKVVPQENSTAKPLSLDERKSLQLFAYANNDQNINDRTTLTYGLRATGFMTLGAYYKTFIGVEPKATLLYMASKSTSLKLSAGRNYQFQHLLTSSAVGLPTDIWMPSDRDFKPQHADQFAAGIYKLMHNDMYEAGLELYYRQSKNIIDFRDNAQVFMNENIETEILTGKAKGYGAEMQLKKNKGASTGWVSYTLSRAVRQVNGINNNEWYPATYDHRHNVSLVYSYAFNKRWRLSANWIYRSGGRTTIPIGTYVYNGLSFMYYGKRNGYTLPDIHRLDLNLSLQGRKKPKRKLEHEWVLSIYNVYHRKNVFAMQVSQWSANMAIVKPFQLYLTGILPSLTWNFKL
jgi:hypothetical protein